MGGPVILYPRGKMSSPTRKLAVILSALLVCSIARAEEGTKPAPGVDLWGRPGYLLTESFERFAPGTWIFSTHYAFQSFASGENVSLLPFGLTYMATDDLVLYLNDSYKLYTAGEGLNLFVVGAKYGLRVADPAWQFSLGGNLSTGPLSSSLGPSTTDFVPEGTVSYCFSNGLTLNFALGVYLPGGGWPSYLRFDPGLAYPLSSDLTAMLELTGHHSQEGPTNPGSSMAFGLRGNGPLHLQAFFGLGTSGDAPSYYGGVSLLIASSLFDGLI